MSADTLTAAQALASIAERYGQQAVLPLAASARARRWTPEALEELRLLRAQGLTAAQIGEQLGLKAATVAAVCRQHGIPSPLSPAGHGRGEYRATSSLDQAQPPAAAPADPLAGLSEEQIEALWACADDAWQERQATSEHYRQQALARRELQESSPGEVPAP